MDAASFDVESLLTQRALDIDIGYRAKQFALLTCVRTDTDGESFQLAFKIARFGLLHLALGERDALVMFEGAQAFLICFDREFARKKVVARKARAHLYHVSGSPQIRDVLA